MDYQKYINTKIISKIQNYNNLPTFSPVIDTTNTANYEIAKFLSFFLNALTENEFTITDSFKLANRIQTISS